MNVKIYGLLIFSLILFVGISSVSAHGADLTEDTMIIANDSNGIIAKSIVDDLGLEEIKVYKYVSDGDVEHQLEHALSNPNKRILAISYQDTVNEFLNKHPDLKNRIIISDDDNNSIADNAKKLVAIDVNSNDSGDFTTPLIVGLIIGVLIGLTAGVFLMKYKN
ncbi:hypothetical protein [Methanobrevibacter sp.]|uniref:hypothetical protein n=1 Tax=Methanobrevibacter sp. TaxID=66852 RepID=UPI0026E09689|nr:hypothetical protein [Methanobrevibacter sp.]MDO5824213.1 hypothetical protein [Methanobrevibacter sp.]